MKSNAGLEPLLREGKRRDDRLPTATRPFFVKLGVLANTTGSSYVEMRTTKVLCGVHGPREGVKSSGAVDFERGQLACDVKYAAFSGLGKRPSAGDKQATALERELTTAVQVALEPVVQLQAFPKLTVEVSVVILESGGSDAAVAITAASAALAHAGIPMNDLVTACCASRVEGSVLLDPVTEEAMQEDGGLLLAAMGESKELTHVLLAGEWPTEQASMALELALDACGHICGHVRKALAAEVRT